MTNKEALFKRVFESSKNRIYRLCLGFMGNKSDADDLFQEVLIRVWSSLDRFRGDSHINTWIYRITTNTALLYLKRRSKSANLHAPLEPGHIQSGSPEVEHATDHEQEQKINELYRAIATLREIDRIIIGLLLEECSYAEIAGIVGLQVSNVGVRINRIKKTLNKKLKQNGWS